jgi:uncharacterized membrane protein
LKKNPALARLIVAAIFTLTGVLHFAQAKAFISIVPDGFPNPPLLVALSGAAELCGAIGILIPRTRRIASYGLIALLIAVFPANISMAIHADRFAGIPAWALWARLPLQIILGSLVWEAGR